MKHIEHKIILAISLIYLFLTEGCTPMGERVADGMPVIPNPNLHTVVVTEPMSLKNSDIFSEVGFVLLDTIPAAYMSFQGNMKVYKNRIFILDMRPGSLLVFDMSGKLINKIGMIGRGPKELLSMDMFDIDYQRDRIVIADRPCLCSGKGRQIAHGQVGIQSLSRSNRV
jgi:hypothetical protein